MDIEQMKDFNAFKIIMIGRLEENEWKDGWIECETSFLIEQFRNKIHTVNQICDMSILESLNKYPDSKTMIECLQRFLADVANYAMMISGNVGRSLK